jgi:hypothetical protein
MSQESIVWYAVEYYILWRSSEEANKNKPKTNSAHIV